MPSPVSNDDFLLAVFGPDWQNAHVTAFPEDPSDLETLGLRHQWMGTKWSRWARKADLPNWNAYFVISLFRDDDKGTARRTKALFRATHVIVVDDVWTKVDGDGLLGMAGEPSYKLETSPGNEQWGYVLARPEGDAGRVNAMLDGMVASGLCADGKDPGMKGVTRYVRLPEGTNHKAKYGPGGFRHVMNAWTPSRVFDLEKLASAFGITLPAPGTVRAAPGRIKVDAAEDELLGHLDRWGMVQGMAADGEGYQIECPWVGEHTQRADTGAGYWLNGAFKCFHGSCADRGRRELEKWADARLAEESGGLVRLSAWDFPVVPGYRPPAGRLVCDAVGGVSGTGTQGTQGTQGTGTQGTQGTPRTVVDEFFDEMVYVTGEDRFYDLRSDQLLVHRAVDLEWAARLGGVGALPVLNKAGELMAPSKWYFEGALRPRARIVDVLTYWPGGGRLLEDGAGRRLVNRWTGEPGTGLPVGDVDVAGWLKLVRYVCARDGAGTAEWLLDWMAMVVGEPGVKPGWHVLMQGPQGVGKDMIVQPVRRGVGERNVGLANAGSLHSSFNPWAEKRVVVLNELKQTSQGGASGADQYNALKELTENTSPVLRINQKNQREYTARNVSAFYITSNDQRAITMDADDRRLMVVMAGDADDTPPWDAAEYAKLASWMENGGDALAADWLRERWDAMDAGRRRALVGRAPMTPGKQAMIRLTEDPAQAWLREQIETGALPDLMTAADISQAFQGAQRAGALRFAPSAHKWSQMLRALGGDRISGGAAVRLKSGKQARLYATRDAKRFTGMSEGALSQAYLSAAGHAFADEDTDKITPFPPKKP